MCHKISLERCAQVREMGTTIKGWKNKKSSKFALIQNVKPQVHTWGKMFSLPTDAMISSFRLTAPCNDQEGPTTTTTEKWWKLHRCPLQPISNEENTNLPLCANESIPFQSRGGKMICPGLAQICLKKCRIWALNCE